MPVSFNKSATGFTLTTELWLPHPIEDVFAFFGDARNLGRITPPWLGFRILTATPITMREGALLEYRIGLWGFPIRWRTRIPVWDPPHGFVDEQLAGPYTRWVHEHRFVRSEGGTLCTDRVDYAHRGGPIGEALFVRPQLRWIFEFRAASMRAWAGRFDRNMFGIPTQSHA